jgi:hypothetical protein
VTAPRHNSVTVGVDDPFGLAWLGARRRLGARTTIAALDVRQAIAPQEDLK